MGTRQVPDRALGVSLDRQWSRSLVSSASSWSKCALHDLDSGNPMSYFNFAHIDRLRQANHPGAEHASLSQWLKSAMLGYPQASIERPNCCCDLLVRARDLTAV